MNGIPVWSGLFAFVKRNQSCCGGRPGHSPTCSQTPLALASVTPWSGAGMGEVWGQGKMRAKASLCTPSLKSCSWPIAASVPPIRTTTSWGLFSPGTDWVGSNLKCFNFPVASACSQWREKNRQPGIQRPPSACLSATAHAVATSIPTQKGTGPKSSLMPIQPKFLFSEQRLQGPLH